MYSNECWTKLDGRCLVSPFEEDLDYSSAISILGNIYRKHLKKNPTRKGK
jgi:hypothetical protein